MELSSFEKLEVYQLSVSFTAEVYDIFKNIEDKFLVSQIKRSTASIPLNIAEGSASNSKRDYLNHINYAYKSSSEVKCTINLCKELGFISTETQEKLLESLDSIRKRLYRLRSTLMKSCDFRAGDRFKFYLDKSHNI